jgi:hypothetical protein
MADLSRFSDAQLEAMLRELGSGYPYPATPELAVMVRSRIASQRVASPAPLRRWQVPWRIALVAAVLLLLLSAGALANPATRDAIAHFFKVGGVVVSRVPSPLATPSPLTSIYLGTPTDLQHAQAAVKFKVVVPDGLGQPDAVYLDSSIPGGEVALAYRPRSGLPAVKETGLGLLITEFAGNLAPDALLKVAGPGTTTEETAVNGDPAWWLQGEPHLLVIREGEGQSRPETLRLASNTLVWEHQGITYRIESNLCRSDAMRIASGMP